MLRSVEIGAWTDGERETRLPALAKADGVFDRFLRDSAPYSVAMRCAVFAMVGVSSKDFERMSDAYREHRGLQPIRDRSRGVLAWRRPSPRC